MSIKNIIKREIPKLKSRMYFAIPFRSYIINAIRYGQLSGIYIPRVIYIEVTNRCNAKCYMCPHEKMERGLGNMPWHIFEKIVNECSEFEGHGLDLILHKDGEPLLDPMLFQRIEYIKKVMKKSKVYFNTNAMLLNEDKTMKILNSPLDAITFSVDGASKETYENIRIGLQYDTVIRNIDNFLKRKAELNRNIHVTMQMVVDKTNMHEVEEYKRLWRDKADRVFCKEMHNFLVQATSVYGNHISDKQQRRCLMPFSAMLFYWNGDVGLCCWDYDNIACLGNIEKEPLLKIYNNPKFIEIRNAMIKKACKGIKPCNICSQIYGQDGPPWQ